MLFCALGIFAQSATHHNPSFRCGDLGTTCVDQRQAQQLLLSHVAVTAAVEGNPDSQVLQTTGTQGPLMVTLAQDANNCDVVYIQSIVGIPYASSNWSRIVIGAVYQTPINTTSLQTDKNHPDPYPVSTASTNNGYRIITAFDLVAPMNGPIPSPFFIGKTEVFHECQSRWTSSSSTASYMAVNSQQNTTVNTTATAGLSATSSVTVDSGGNPLPVAGVTTALMSDGTVQLTADNIDAGGIYAAFVDDVAANVTPTFGRLIISAKDGNPPILPGATLQVALNGVTIVQPLAALE
jgi:hypothetical protein